MFHNNIAEQNDPIASIMKRYADFLSSHPPPRFSLQTLEIRLRDFAGRIKREGLSMPTGELYRQFLISE